MAKNVEIMAQHIEAQADMFDRYAKGLYEKCLSILERHDAGKRISKVFLTGCGDSYYAGMCVKDFYTLYTGLHTEPLEALELSRYVLPYEVDEHSLVVSISASGSVARTAECAIRAGEKGALSIGVTTNPKSRLAEVSPELLYIELEENLGLAPGTQSYCASLLSLYCLGMALGKILGKLDDEDIEKMFSKMSSLSSAMRITAQRNSKPIRDYLERYFDEEKKTSIKMFHILGSGPSAGTANFGVMKLLEAAGFDSLAQGVEEWAHSQYFTTAPDIHTIVLAQKGKSHERAVEILSAIKVKEGNTIIIGEENDVELLNRADFYFPICGAENIDEEFSGLLYCVPLELIAMHISDIVGHSGFDFENKPWVKEENFKQIFHSRIVKLEDEQ